jgi:hypothetical protein
MKWRSTTRAWSTWMWTRNLRFCAGKSASPPAAVLFRRKTANRLLWAAVAAGWFVLRRIAAAGLYHYGEQSWRFRVELERQH